MAESVLDLIFRTRKTGDGESKAVSGLKGVSNAFQELTGISLGAGAALGMATSALRYSIAQAVESERIHAQLNAVLKSTGEAAGLTADDIDRMAQKMSNLTAVEDDAIVAASSVMLTFTQIGREAFPIAMQSALDLSTALGQDLQSSVVQIGKALNDPIQGITALSRVGVSFTKDQKDLIKTLVETGDVLGAQKVILNELSKEFGGSAAAAADTFEGKVKKLENTIGNLAEVIGGPLISVLSDAADTLLLLINWNQRIDDALIEHEGTVSRTAATYAEYRAEMERAAAAAGRLDLEMVEYFRTMGAEESAIEEAILSAGIMSEAQWEAARATQEAAAQAAAAAPQIEAMAGGYEAAAAAAEASSRAAHTMGQATLDLLGAQEKLADAEASWQEGAGNDIAAMLEKRVGTGKKYEEALSAIDSVMGTSLLTEEQLKDSQQELINQYATGQISIDQFKEGLQELTDQFMPLDESIQTSTELIRTLKAKLEEISRTWWVQIKVNNQTGVHVPNVDTSDSSDLVTKATGGPVYPMQGAIVGEYGPELLRLPPGGGGGEVIPEVRSGLTLGPVYINNGMDLEELMYRISERIR